MKKIKVVIVGHSYLAKENQKNLDHISKYVDIEVISPNHSEGMIFNYNLDENVIYGKNWIIRLYKKIKIPFIASAIYLLYSYNLNLKKFKPDIIHIESDPFTPIFWQTYLYKKLFCDKAKIVCTIKQNTITKRNFILDKIKKIIGIFFSNKVDRFIAVNKGVEAIYNNYFNVPLDKILQSTQLGVDTKLFINIDDRKKQFIREEFGFCKGDIIIGYVGRLAQYKGLPELIEVSKKISNAIQGKLAIVGDGPMLDEIKNLSKETKNIIFYLGTMQHSKISRFLQSIDIFVMPSRVFLNHEEHDSHALLEAMSTGVPCIATKSGSNIDVLSKNGVMIESENTIELYNAILKIYKDKKLYSILSSRNREMITKNFSLEKVASNYNQVYQMVIKNDK